ncbi:MAG TPA: hypothetical protein VGB64_12780 [Actinomycetota bacterium]
MKRLSVAIISCVMLTSGVQEGVTLPGGGCGPGNLQAQAVNAGAVTAVTEDWYDASFDTGRTSWTFGGGNAVMTLYTAADIAGGCAGTSWGSCWAGAGYCVFGRAVPGQYLIRIATGGPLSSAGGAYVLLTENQ